MPEGVAHVTDPELLELADELDVSVPRGEPRRRLADVADALVRRASPEDVRALSRQTLQVTTGRSPSPSQALDGAGAT